MELRTKTKIKGDTLIMTYPHKYLPDAPYIVIEDRLLRKAESQGVNLVKVYSGTVTYLSTIPNIKHRGYVRDYGSEFYHFVQLRWWKKFGRQKFTNGHRSKRSRRKRNKRRRSKK